jgi:hypothetical protein
MNPDFGDIIARSIVHGAVGVLTQPIVILTLALVIGVAILMHRHRRHRAARRRSRQGRRH